MQVYRGLDIGTAKPSAAERASVPHHLLDICDLSETFDAARFVELASAAAEGITMRNHTPIFCGGTGLYFKALLEGLGEAPASEPTLRQELRNTPLDLLLAELARGDPGLFATIDKQNPRRVIRAVEVLRLTGKPFSAQRALWGCGPSTALFGVLRERHDLHDRINRRVDLMFENGLVEETRALLGRGLEQNEKAMQALGYRQVVEHLRGQRSLAETIELVKSRTRNFAKRQMTWFNKHLQVTWLNLASEQTRTAAIDCLLSGI